MRHYFVDIFFIMNKFQLLNIFYNSLFNRYSQVMEFVEDDLPLPSFDDVFNNNTIEFNSDTFLREQKFRVVNEKSSSHLNSKANQSQTKKVKTKSSTSSSGRWTMHEHKMFLQGVQMYGYEYKKMQELIKTRSVQQIRTHAQKVFRKDIANIRTKLASVGVPTDIILYEKVSYNIRYLKTRFS
jgi:SHAQKYF class myb-like DNA-binding protein